MRHRLHNLAQGRAADDGLLVIITVVSPVSRRRSQPLSSLPRTALSKTDVSAERDDIGYLRARQLLYQNLRIDKG